MEIDAKLIEIIGNIHAARTKLVYEFTGAGSVALSWLHSVAGSSRTIIEATDRYARESLISLLGAEPEKFVSQNTAAQMAQAAYQRAKTLSQERTIGVSCTATISTDRERRGQNHGWVGVASQEETSCYGLVLQKGARTRAAEEELFSRLVLRAIAQTLGLQEVELALLEGEQLIIKNE
jgi:nicotinamide mononucleotide (NMN) deamidase PncC